MASTEYSTDIPSLEDAIRRRDEQIRDLRRQLAEATSTPQPGRSGAAIIAERVRQAHQKDPLVSTHKEPRLHDRVTRLESQVAMLLSEVGR